MRWIVRLVLMVAVLGLLGLGALFLIPAERVAAVAARQFEAATGRALSVEGDLRPTLWPVVGISTGAVSIANAPWSEAGPMIAAERLVVGVEALPLLSGEIAVRELRIERPRILLERHADGSANWEIAGSAGGGGDVADEDGGSLPKLAVESASITGGLIRYVDHASGQETVLSDADLTLGLPGLAGRARIEGSARFNGAPITLAVMLDGVEQMLAGTVRPVELRLETGGNTVAFVGRASADPVAAEGRLEADLTDLASLLALAGQPPAELPPGLGRERIALSGDVTLSGAERVFLRGGMLRLDGNTIRVDADVALAGERPRLVAQLAADTLDLSGLAGGDSGGAGGGSAGWPAEAIDVSGLSAADAEVALSAQAVRFGDFALGATDIVARLEGGRLATEIRRLAAFEGTLSGEVVVNGRSGLSVGGDLAAAGMQLQPMLTALADYDRLLGPLEARVKFLGSGPSVDAIMKSLSGEGRVDIGQGELQGLDIAGMLRNLDTGYRGPGAKTIFRAITGSYTIAGGVLTNEDLNFDAPLVPATGKGRVDVGNQTLKYRVTPAALGRREEAGVTGGVRVPVLIEGPWANLSIRPDVEKMLEGEIDKRRDEVEGKVQEEIGKRLGIEAVEGEKVEDTLKRGIEEKATDALKGLLGGKKQN